MIKRYILDTCVLLQDPNAMFHFEDNEVIIPIGVIEELDRFKKESNELGRNARAVSRELDTLRLTGDLREGVPLACGGKLKVSYNGNLNSFYKEDNVDLHVIHIAQETVKRDSTIPCIIVSRDVNVRIRANALGLLAEDYKHDKVEEDQIDAGFTELECPIDIIDLLSKEETLIVDQFDLFKGYYPNHYFNIKNAEGKRGILGKISSDGLSIVKVNTPNGGLPVRPRNREQTFVLDALLDPNINLVAVSGKAGCGKTLLCVAAGFHLTCNKGEYEKFLVSRPVFPMGKDLGFLPGTVDEKLDPWMQPIYDAFDVINKGKSVDGRKMVMESHKIKVEPLTYIRGRSIHRQFVLIDESQNLSQLEVKTIITRAGEGTKIVFTGDIEQIDNPYIDKYSNGLTAVIEAFKSSGIAAHIVMTRGVRSALAEEATVRM